MMIAWDNLILAEDDGWLEFMSFLIFVVISIVVSIAKGANKQPRTKPLHPRAKPRKPQHQEWLSLPKEKPAEPEWINVAPVPAPPPLPEAKKTDKLGTHYDERCEHSASARTESHVHREVADAPEHYVSEDRRAVRVNLSQASQLRKAMILHEIFSHPVALREERPLWDE